MLYDKSETASLLRVSTNALMFFIIVDAHKGRDVATADVTGAYLNAEMDDFVVMKFTDNLVDIFCQMRNPLHKRFMAMDKGIKVLYVWLVKAIYRCVKSAFLWYNLFNNTLNEMCFVLNPYERSNHASLQTVLVGNSAQLHCTPFLMTTRFAMWTLQ
jgi:hypothetical protein